MTLLNPPYVGISRELIRRCLKLLLYTTSLLKTNNYLYFSEVHSSSSILSSLSNEIKQVAFGSYLAQHMAMSSIKSSLIYCSPAAITAEKASTRIAITTLR